MVEADEKEIRQYLLGQLGEAELSRFEERLMTDDGLFEMLRVVEDELIDERAADDLSTEEQARFDTYFLATPERRERLEMARALHDYAARRAPVPEEKPALRITNEPANAIPSEEPSGGVVEGPPRSARVMRLPRWLSTHPYISLAAAAIILVALGVGLGPRIISWWDMQRGMAALNKAYAENPTESRITGLSLPPPSVTRGADSNKIDKVELKRAERYLDDALREHATARSYHAAGCLYLAERDFDEAIKSFEQALRLDAGDARLYSDLGAAWLEKCKTNQPADNGGKTFECLGKSLDYLTRALQLDDGLPEALFDRALCYEYMARPQEARQGWQKYLEKDPNSPWAVEAKHRLLLLEHRSSRSLPDREMLFQQFATAYRTADDASAWEAFRQSRTRTGNMITDRLLDGSLSAFAVEPKEVGRGNLYMLAYAGKLEFQKVGDHFTKDLARFYQRQLVQQHDKTVEARRLLKTAAERIKQSEYEQAAACYSQAQRLFEQTGDEAEAALAGCGIGLANLRIAPKQSLIILPSLCRSLESRTYLYLLSQALNGLADAQSSQRNISECLEAGRRGAEVAERIEDLNGILRNWQIAVAVYLQVGKYRESLEWVFRSLDRAQPSAADPLEVWTFYHQAALDFYWLDLPYAALDFQQAALRLALASGRGLYKSRSYARLGLIYEKLQDQPAAIRNAELALAEGRDVEGEKSRANIVANAALHLADLYRKHGDLKQSLTYYDQAIDSHAGLGIEIYILEAHRGKLLALLGLPDDTAVEEELKQALPLVEQYRPKILEESNRNSFFDLAQSIYDAAIDFADSRLHQEQLAFDYLEACHARSLLDLMHSSSSVIDREGRPEIQLSHVSASLTCEDVKLQLQVQAQILEYSVLDNRVLAFVVSRGDVKRGLSYVAADELAGKLNRYLSLVKQHDEGTEGELATLAGQLYGLLIQPVEPLLDRSKYLCIVPDKMLYGLPFGALLSPSGRYFVEDHLIGRAPSSSIFIACTNAASEKETLSNEHLLAVGDPMFDRSQFAGLPSAAREVREVARLYNASPLIGNQAKEEVVKREMRRAEVIHLASHFITDERSPLLSKLLLAKVTDEKPGPADDGFLHSSEIYDMQLPRTRIVVLSACQTGLEQSYRGEGAISMARPFIKAGVPLIIASLWATDSDAAADLMISLHRHRKSQGGKPTSTAAALQAAQLDMLYGADSRNHHPYYWASFAAIGGYTTF